MARKVKILLAEDENSLALIVKESLESRGFEVIWCENGKEAIDAYQRTMPDILVLDVMMPVKDGFTLAKEIRKKDENIPIIFLTAKSRTEDVVDGFNHGGNDYLKKPFSMEELIVRVNELVNRKEKRIIEDQINIGRYVFNYPKQQLIFDEEEQLLTSREAELLRRLASKQNELSDRSAMLKEIWGDDDFFNARSMDVFITKLRKKLKKDPNIKIVNVRGYGYKLIC